MSTIKYVILSLVLLTVAIEAKKILRAQAGAAKTGKFVVALDLDTSDERFYKLVKKVSIEADDKEIQRVNGNYAKIITAKLSERALEMVCFKIITCARVYSQFCRSKTKLM